MPLLPPHRLLLLLASAALVVTPFALVTFPPSTDLPQHVAQVRLFVEALRTPDGPYVFQPFTPYLAAYGVFGLLWTVCSPLDVGRWSLAVLGALWVLGVHALAARRARAPESAVLASALFFNHVLTWGFASFLAGWPVYLLWLQLTSRPSPLRARSWLLHALAAAALFWSHALWFAAGVVTLVLQWLLQRLADRRSILLQGSAVVPVGLLALWWYPQLSARGFDSETAWFISIAQRVSFTGMRDAVLGSLRSPVETAVFGFVLAWLGLGLWQARRELRARLDLPLLAPALLFLGLWLVLPNKYSNTIHLAERWVPFAFVLLLLALPSPRLRPGVLGVASLGPAALLVTFTCLSWRQFERTDLAGLRASLAALPEGQRVLGLDFLKTSPTVKGRPFLQLFAYAQVERGGTLSFSFADFAPSPVVYADMERRVWTRKLEWYAERVRPADFRHFDYVLIGATERDHQVLSTRRREVAPVTTEGLWRLYRVAVPST